MHDIHKTLYLMAKRDEDLLNEGLKAKVAAGAILGGVALGMIPPPPQTPPQTQQTQQTPPQTQQTPPQTPVIPPVTPPTTTTCVGPNCTRLLDTISYAEGTDRYPESGYLTQFSGKQFTNTSAHPDEKIKSKNGIVSSAAGRYQILKKTYTDIGMENMTPAEQDRGALKLIQRRLKLKSPEEVESYLSKNGIDDKALDSLSREWASITDSTGKGRYGQPTKTKEQIRARFAKTATPTETTPTIKKESYKDKIRMYLREVFEQLPGSDLNFDYGEVFGPKGIMSPDSATKKEPGDLELSDRAIRTRTDSNMPGVVETIGHRVGSEPFGGILRVRSETNMNPQHPDFKKIETHVYDGGTRIGSFTSRFTYGHTHTSSMAHDMTNNFNFKKGSNSEELTNRRAMDAGAQEFFQRALNQNSELSDLAIDTNLQRVVERHFNETMGGRRNKKISEYHRGLEGTENPSDGPGDGSSYGELT